MRWLRALAVVVALVLVCLQVTLVRAADPWWQRVAFAGHTVSQVSAGGGRLAAEVDGVRQVATAGGVWRLEPGGVTGPVPLVVAGRDHWRIEAGRVKHATDAGSFSPDPGSPDLGVSADLLASPAALPGTVLAVTDTGAVWRRKDTGDWSHSLLLLPAGLASGIPAITSIAAFADQPVSGVVYIGTRGYGTLLTSDGGDDWTRADPGLPGNVLALAADGTVTSPALYAGTDDGLWVHRLQKMPQIPVYALQDLLGRALLTVLVVLVASAGAAVGLVRFGRAD